MRRWLTFRRLMAVAVLVFAWCSLWGEISVANVVSGTVVAFGATAIGTPGRGGVRFGPLVRLAGLVALDMVTSTVSVAREILTPTDRTDEAVVAVPVPGDARTHLLLLIVAITVTPGTAVIDADPDASVLYLHMLHADRRDATAAHVQRLATLACQALPTGPAAVAEEARP